MKQPHTIMIYMYHPDLLTSSADQCVKDVLLNPSYEDFAAASCNTAICCTSID